METPLPPIEKKSKDSDIRRATYTLDYPTSTINLNSKLDYPDLFEGSNKQAGISYIVHAKNLDINYSFGTIEGTEFSQCRFYIDGKASNTLSKLTFRNCLFSNCFLGTIVYNEIKFENCSFLACDFMHARFINCIFEKSLFDNCTAQNCYFENSEIDSVIFIDALKPTKNKFEKFGHPEPEINELIRKIIHSNYDISKNIYRSNIAVGNSNYIDRSLFVYKKIEISFLIDSFRYKNENTNSKKENIVKCILFRRKYILPILGRKLNMILTRGGTSLWRLIWIALLSIAIFNYYFFDSKISNSVFNIEYSKEVNSIQKYLMWLPETISDFLGFGFTAFKASTIRESNQLILCAAMGLIWYALLIPVLIRKIYR